MAVGQNVTGEEHKESRSRRGCFSLGGWIWFGLISRNRWRRGIQSGDFLLGFLASRVNGQRILKIFSSHFLVSQRSKRSCSTQIGPKVVWFQLDCFSKFGNSG